MKRAQSANLDLALQPKQWELFRCLTAKGYDIPTNLGYGGSRGGSKSGGAQRCALSLAVKEPKIGLMIFRRLSADLIKNHINKFLETWPELEPYYEATNKRIALPEEWGGSYIDFMHAETSKEIKAKTRGIEWKYIFIDQSEELLEEDLKRIETCNRWPGTSQGECKCVYLFNPGGPGTEYLRRIFFLKQYQGKEKASSYHFIQAYGWDNYQWLAGTGLISEEGFYALSSEERFELFVNHSDYGMKMNALPESLRMGELMGRFDSFAGQYFAGVWDESKCILPISKVERLVQNWWKRWMATDWGFAHYAAHGWAAAGKVGPSEFKAIFGIDTEWSIDVVVITRELVVNETAEDDLAEMVAEKTPSFEKKQIQRNFLSPDAFAKRGSANTISDQMNTVFRMFGLPTTEPADNDRVGGWRFMYHGFKQTCSLLSGGEITQEMAMGGPMVLVSSNCPRIIESLPILVRDEDNLEDVLKTPTMADDVGDMVRYLLKSMLSPRVKAPAAVRAQEVFEAAGSMTAKAMAMRQFAERERKTGGGMIIRPMRRR